MLKQRILTALVLLAILLPALAYPSFVPLAVVTLILIATGCWEWGRLNGLAQAASLGLAAVGSVLCLASWWVGWIALPLPWLWQVAGAAWVLLGGWLLARGVAGWPQTARWLRLAGGVLALWLAWLAMARARAIGINFLLSILCLVWVADICAYFAGRALGRRKLAPAISPGKSWEGAYGAVVGVSVYGLLCLSYIGYPLAEPARLLLALVGLVAFTAVSIIGDLFESLVKRQAGVKDSGTLLPGHGGILDRIDSLTSTLPLAALVVLWIAK